MKHLTPHKLKPLNKNILVVSKYLLDLLKDEKNKKFNDIVEELKQKLNINEKIIVFAINFLFVFDKIDYDVNKDILRLKNEI